MTVVAWGRGPAEPGDRPGDSPAAGGGRHRPGRLSAIRIHLSEPGVSLDWAREQVVRLLDEHRRAQGDQTGWRAL